MTSTNLRDICSARYTNQEVDTLTISAFGGSWDSQTWNGLLRICRCFRVVNVIMTAVDSEQEELEVLRGIAEEGYAFLPELKSITVMGWHADPAFMGLVNKSRVTSITFQESQKSPLSFLVSQVLMTFKKYLQSIFNRWSVGQIYFIHWKTVTTIEQYVPNLNYSFFCSDPLIGTSELLATRERCIKWLDRNRRAWKKCQKACLILLALRRVKGHQIGRLLGKDVSVMVAALVWETRGTSIWGEKAEV